MIGNFIKKYTSSLDKKYVERLKPLLLKHYFNLQKKNGKKFVCYDDFCRNKKIEKYLNYNYKLLDIALGELVIEHKIEINDSDSPKSVSLTEEAFNYFLNNPHPIKNWLKSNWFNLISCAFGFWGGITGTLALFIK